MTDPTSLSLGQAFFCSVFSGLFSLAMGFALGAWHARAQGRLSLLREQLEDLRRHLDAGKRP
jgi:uncharacterized membrane protein